MSRTVSRQPLRLLSISHSYCVSLNRRLPHEIAIRSEGDWDVTAVAPKRFPGDLGVLQTQRDPAEACHVIRLPLHLSRWVHLMLYSIRLRRILRQPWHLVHCWEEPFIMAGGQVASWTPRQTPLVFATFQNIPKRYPPPFRQIERRAMGAAAGWIPFGETSAEALGQRPGYRDRPWQVIPVGVDTHLFRPDPQAGRELRRSLGWHDATAVIGFVGRFVPEKGVQFLMDVLDRLGLPWRALWVGGGPLERRLRHWAEQYPGRVHLAAGVRHEQVPGYLNAMDVLCAPSRTTPQWKEQFGRMLIEGLSCGLPVIGSRSGEIPRILGDCGRTVSEEDADGWSRCLSELLGQPGLRHELGQAGRQKAEMRYAWPVVAQQHLEFFARLLPRV